ncbi:hypothetical protein Tco_0317642 [Tanacetum coccineum]
MGIMPTETKLALEQSQQGVSYEVSAETRKGLKRQKEAKTIKNRQRNGKKTKTRAKGEEFTSRISPTQQERQSKEEIIKSRAKSDKLRKFEGLLGSFKVKGTKVVKEEKLLLKKKE